MTHKEATMDARQTTQEDQDRLEEMIDRTSLGAVLGSLTIVCLEKAEHIASNWQDDGLATEWARSARRIAKLADTLPRVPAIHHRA